MAQTEEEQAVSEIALRYDTMTGATIGGTMGATNCKVEDQVVFCISRATTTSVPTDRLTTITFGTDSFTSTANLSGLPVEILWMKKNI